MTETIENLMLEQLRLIRNELVAFRVETREHFIRLEVQVGALGQQVAAIATAVYSGHDRFPDIERRLIRIESRLELSD